MNPDPTPCSKPNLPTAANPRPLIFSKNNKPRRIQRDNVIPRVERILFGLWSFQEVVARLLLPHAFGFSVWFPPSLCFSSNSLFFLSGLDLMMLHCFPSSNSLFFLSGLDLMMLRCFSSSIHCFSCLSWIWRCFIRLDLMTCGIWVSASGTWVWNTQFPTKTQLLLAWFQRVKSSLRDLIY